MMRSVEMLSFSLAIKRTSMVVSTMESLPGSSRQREPSPAYNTISYRQAISRPYSDDGPA